MGARRPDALPHIWSWHPVLVFLFVLGVDFGAVLVLRLLTSNGQYFFQWKTFMIGDTVALPTYAAATSFVVRRLRPAEPAWYSSRVWHLTTLVAGYCLAAAFLLLDLASGFGTVAQKLSPGTLYHAIVYGPLFYLLVSALPAVIWSRRPKWAAGIAALALAGYLALWMAETSARVPIYVQAVSRGIGGV